MPDWYPESALEANGIPPDDFNAPGCYTLALDAPDGIDALRDRWFDVYVPPPPEALSLAVDAGKALVYVGAAASLLDRLHDHVDAEVRRSGLLRVCPPTGLASAWVCGSADEAFEREVQYAIKYSNVRPGVSVACNGDWF